MILEVRIDQGNSRSPIYVVITVNHNFLTFMDSFLYSLDGHIHILHQERIVQIFEIGAKKLLSPLKGFNTPLGK